MPRCALIVDFRLKPGQRAAFDAIMKEHARLTRVQEPGCRQFDVLHPDDEAERVILVEIYEDRAAYEAHRAGPRMPGVHERIAPLVESRAVTRCALE